MTNHEWDEKTVLMCLNQIQQLGDAFEEESPSPKEVARRIIKRLSSITGYTSS